MFGKFEKTTFVRAKIVSIIAFLAVLAVHPGPIVAETGATNDTSDRKGSKVEDNPGSSKLEEKIKGPPQWGTFRPERYSSDEVTVSHDEVVEFHLSAKTLEGDFIPVTIDPEFLPEGAKWEPKEGHFRWDPKPSQAGRNYLLQFRAKHGQSTIRRRLYIRVRPNKAPNPDFKKLVFKPAMESSKRLKIKDPDHPSDEIDVKINDLPEGAVFDSKTQKIRWKPEPIQVGPHKIEVILDDGIQQTRTERVLFVPKDPEYEGRRADWNSYFIPGVHYSLYAPSNSKYGTLQGGTMELALYSWGELNANRGPSHGRIYANLSLMEPMSGGGSTWAILAAGTRLSMERSPDRHWLVPFFGGEAGMLHAEDGNHFEVTPEAGVHLWTDRNKFIGLSGGYLIVPQSLDDLSGWRANLGATVTFW